MNEICKCSMLQKDGSRTALSIEVPDDEPWALRVSGSGFAGQLFLGDDLFDAMIALRREMEQKGARLLCVGARIDTYPSGMARSMGAARKVYKTRLGHSATELFDIFDEADADHVGTIEQQLNFHNEWIESLRHRK